MARSSSRTPASHRPFSVQSADTAAEDQGKLRINVKIVEGIFARPAWSNASTMAVTTILIGTQRRRSRDFIQREEKHRGAYCSVDYGTAWYERN